MRKSILYALIIPLFAGMVACSEERDIESQNVPDIVITNFNSRYPGAQNIKWKTEKNDGKKVYEAAFVFNGVSAEVEYDEQGNFIKQEE